MRAWGMTLGSVVAALASTASAQVQKTGDFSSLDLAMETAAEAVRACAEKGWPVSVSIVDASGNIKLQARGDHNTIHTKIASYRKAYTTVTMGPIFGFDTLGAWVEKLATNPYASAYASLPDIFLLPGAVAVKVRGEIVAAIGVRGAPGGDKDELCATAGLAKIKDRLPQ
jgi:uncharacterized protein GlcG (DUF336 family)